MHIIMQTDNEAKKRCQKIGEIQEVIVEHLWESLEMKRMNLKAALNVVPRRKIVRNYGNSHRFIIYSCKRITSLTGGFIMNTKAAKRKETRVNHLVENEHLSCTCIHRWVLAVPWRPALLSYSWDNSAAPPNNNNAYYIWHCNWYAFY